ncbi:acetyltransferase [Streptomyces sp. MBT65]|uniref:GNAT family N-acetyltransferase n=1 Tax=Streptomyces sp. MBT65 TaxID=1488395 RepID=UPI00190A8E1F|nr:GNAT family N-acetyltransferase [Streptomyces sp. MBT65]MBK3581623.1 acetyltransferase [Streptomyces sp. MBT65]
MPPTDASADTATVSGSDLGSRANSSQSPGTDGEDTLDLRLPEGFIALCAEADAADAVLHRAAVPDAVDHHVSASDSSAPDLSVPEPVAHEAGTIGRHHRSGRAGEDTARSDSNIPPASEILPNSPVPSGDDLLDRVGAWGPTHTPVGTFHLLPVHIERDLPLINRWMNDPAVAAFWELAGPQALTGDHLRAQLAGDGRSVPCLGVLEGTPMSYWEIYRADLDPLARRYPARPHDTGIHLLIGDGTDRGRGLGRTLLRAVADLVLDKRAACARIVAEPDIRNTPSVAAFLGAGFRFSAEVDLPAKRAALLVRDRSLRDLL